MTVKPIFLSQPRSRCLPLMEMCNEYLVSNAGLISLKEDVEYFASFTRNCTADVNGLNLPMELIPTPRKTGMTMHYTYPPVFSDINNRLHFKLQTLRAEKEAGREYNIQIMFNSLTLEMFDFFSDRTFVVTKRDDIKGSFLSTILAKRLNIWNRRSRNEHIYESLEKNPVHIRSDIIEDSYNYIVSYKRLDQIVDLLQKRNLKFHIFDYNDLQSSEQRSEALDTIFEHPDWRKDLPIDPAMDIAVDYSKIFYNYDEVIEKVEKYLK